MEMSARKLVRVVAPHFVAGLECTDGKCTKAAPILKYLKGKSENELREFFHKKGWTASIIDPMRHVDKL